jgi:cephalosporin hydroxylase
MNLYNAHKEPHFIEAYQKHFAGRTPKRILEIGVQGGGSLKIWRDFFPEAEIVGVDTLESCKEFETGNIKIFIGDQADVKFLETLGNFDIIIDDGGHYMTQQQVSMNTLLANQLNPGGLYVIEDLHTSYWEQFLDIRRTTVNVLKDMVDDLHQYADESGRCELKQNLKNKYNIKSLTFYSGIVFIEKLCS